MAIQGPKLPPALVARVLTLFGLETLEARKSDSLDFHTLSVWQLEAALRAAYKAGLVDGRARPMLTPEEEDALASLADTGMSGLEAEALVLSRRKGGR